MGGQVGQEVEWSEGRGVGGSRGLEVWRSGGLEVGRSGGLGRKGEGAHGRCVSGCSPFFLMDSSHFTNSLEDMGTRCQWKISVRLIPQFLYCSLRERRCWTIFWCGDAGASAISPAGLLLPPSPRLRWTSRNAGEMPGCPPPRRRTVALPYAHAAGAKVAEGGGLVSGGRRKVAIRPAGQSPLPPPSAKDRPPSSRHKAQ